MKNFPQKNVAVIINPIAAADQPILSLLNSAFTPKDIAWQTYITNKGEDIQKLTHRALKTRPDVLYVLGGDGTQCAVLAGMGKNKTPVAILPAGTANIMGKEFGVPAHLKEALERYVRSSGKTCAVTRCLQDKEPFFLRLSIGVFAEMVAKSTRSKKQQLGVLAYPVSALESWQESRPQTFNFVIDGKKVQAEGISLVVNNFGNIGIPGISFLPEIDPCDQYLDVLVVQAQDIPALVSLAKTTLADKKPSGLLQHWRGKKITVSLPKKSLLIHDDEKQEVQKFTAQVTNDKVYCLLPGAKGMTP